MCSAVEDKQALLVFGASGDYIAWMHDIVEYMLRDIATKIEEIDYIPNPDRSLVPFNVKDEEDRNAHLHHVFRVTLKGDVGIYALDLSGAQYGRYAYESVYPWEIYQESYILTIIRREKFGWLKEWQTKRQNPRGERWQVTASLNAIFCDMIMLMVRTVDQGGGSSVREIVENYPIEAEYMDWLRGMLNLISGALRSAVDIQVQKWKKSVEEFKAKQATELMARVKIED